MVLEGTCVQCRALIFQGPWQAFRRPRLLRQGPASHAASAAVQTSGLCQSMWCGVHCLQLHSYHSKQAQAQALCARPCATVVTAGSVADTTQANVVFVASMA
jgi:hypothetical protein